MPAIYALRRRVFVDEQQVPEALEIDELDATATHLVVLLSGCLAGTLRWVPYPDAIKIGRVAVAAPLRRRGLGTALLQHALTWAALHGVRQVVLDAQLDSVGFYRRLGFVAEGDVFDDAGIPHVRMQRQFS